MLPAFGYAVREQNRSILDDPTITAAEITFERANDPLRIDRYLSDRDFDYVSVHAEKLSVGSPDPPAWDYLESLHAIVVENGACAISDHLGFMRDGNHGIELKRLAPLPCTEAALENVCRNIHVVQEYFAPQPFYVETIANPFQFQGTMSEQEFLSRVLESTHCGLLLDVTSVYANSLNFDTAPLAFIEAILKIPRQIQIRLSGGVWDERTEFYSSSPLHPIPDIVWDLYRHALSLAHGRIDAVFIERDRGNSDHSGWRREFRRAQSIAEDIEVAA